MSDISKKIKEINNLDFESALKELERVVSEIENNSKGLEEAINDYEYGVALKKHLSTKLQEAKLKIDKIAAIDGNNLDLEKFE